MQSFLPWLSRPLPLLTQGELKTTTVAGEASAGRNSAANTPEETLEKGSGGKIASEEEQEKQEGESAETGEAGSGEAAAAAVPAIQNGAGHEHGHGAAVSLGLWEREGLRPLLEVSFAPAFFTEVFGSLPCLGRDKTHAAGGNRGSRWSGEQDVLKFVQQVLCAQL